jgi:NAD(P)-dependent dehydrogenase (short-subunit alcohol dehydrogenase family)
MANRVLITGCSRGIGLSLGITFAKAGWEVVATARRSTRPGLWNAAQEFPNLHVVEMDVLDSASVARAVGEAAKEIGALDVLVNNAAIFPGEGNERLDQLDLDWFDEAFTSNVTAVARVTRAFLPMLRHGRDPKVINISSGAGSISQKEDFDYYPYSVSKAALNMLSRAMAAEFRPQGIIVVPISPGWVRTAMGGENAPLSPDDSAKALYQTISRLKMEHSGRFLGRDGSDHEYNW